MTFSRFSLALLTAALFAVPALAGGPADAGVPVQKGGSPIQKGVDATPQYVEKTVCEPQWVTEKRTITCTQYVPEIREKVVTVYRSVPETHQVTRNYTVMVPEQRTRTVAYTTYRPVYDVVERQYQVCVPVYSTVEQQYTVQVPVYRTEERTYTVNVPHQEMRSGVPPGLQGRSGPGNAYRDLRRRALGNVYGRSTLRRQLLPASLLSEQVRQLR